MTGLTPYVIHLMAWRLEQQRKGVRYFEPREHQRVNLDEDELIRLRVLLELGHTQYSIAKLLGCGLHSVRSYAHYMPDAVAKGRNRRESKHKRQAAFVQNIESLKPVG